MKKAVLFGSGVMGNQFYEQLKNQYDIIWATDNDEKKYGLELAPGILIKDKAMLRKGGYDCVIITTYAGFEEIHEQLVTEFGLNESKIISRYVEPTIQAKVSFLESFAKIVYTKGIAGEVCEAGVYRGGFAKEINRCFPDRTLYLFDTFAGHDLRDIAIERKNHFSQVEANTLAMTSVEEVLAKMPVQSKCVVKKGYFPDTFDLNNEKFCFVNIDFDLYQPIKAALELFYPRMSPGGLILIHDYMWSFVQGASVAVNEFAAKNGLGVAPIGDGVSVMLIKSGKGEPTI